MLGLEGNIVRLGLEKRAVDTTLGQHQQQVADREFCAVTKLWLWIEIDLEIYRSLFLFVPGGVVSVRSSGLVQVEKQDLAVPTEWAEADTDKVSPEGRATLRIFG